MPAHARKKKAEEPEKAVPGTLIDNVDGLTGDGKGGIEHFDGFLITPDGHIAQVYHQGEKRPKYADYRLDGKGQVVVPGMIDAHGHVMSLGFSKLTLDLSGTRSREEALARIRAWTAAHPDAPWILGGGWNETEWASADLPTATELDAVSGGKPAWLTRVDGHAGWANSAALTAAGITAKTNDPKGGRIVRDGAGKPAGVLVDAATALVAAKLPTPRPEDRDAALAEAQLDLLEHGVTAVADMGTSIEDWQAFRRAGDSGRLRLRIVAYADSIANMELIGGPKPTPWLYDDRLRLDGVKLFLDGALGSRGAWLKAPYADAPETSGLPLLNQTQLSNLMSRAALDHFQVAVHAIGDKANAVVLDAIAELSQTYTGDRRWRIEHAQIVSPADIARFGQHGVIASMEPQHEASDRTMAEARLGPERLAGAYAWKSLAATGATLAFGSDTPVEPARPFVGMAVAVTRQGADGQPVGGWQAQEAISREAALGAYTTGAAYAMFAEDRLGRIAKGYRADFLFLDKDPMLASPEALRTITVRETWIGGQRAWAAAQSQQDEAQIRPPEADAPASQGGDPAPDR
ncbi:amidohydrolase family protein [Novosphingobium profundi]|uniref:amidohydrolase n=1 Tax=Novosphingobium profundi TaxID=1774954 RepID=UPI001BDAC37A|nr:amidohydrolase [Novosphingobium profundi]MBT0670056.1 amidohydrolase family protein [Novosphingobium profundi]